MAKEWETLRMVTEGRLGGENGTHQRLLSRMTGLGECYQKNNQNDLMQDGTEVGN